MDSLELRCFCDRHTLLGVCRRNARTGAPFIHIKHKRGRNLSEMIVSGGVVKLSCADCGRWHTIKMKSLKVELPTG